MFKRKKKVTIEKPINVRVGYSLVALCDNPGQIGANWKCFKYLFSLADFREPLHFIGGYDASVGKFPIAERAGDNWIITKDGYLDFDNKGKKVSITIGKRVRVLSGPRKGKIGYCCGVSGSGSPQWIGNEIKVVQHFLTYAVQFDNDPIICSYNESEIENVEESKSRFKNGDRVKVVKSYYPNFIGEVGTIIEYCAHNYLHLIKLDNKIQGFDNPLRIPGDDIELLAEPKPTPEINMVAKCIDNEGANFLIKDKFYVVKNIDDIRTYVINEHGDYCGYGYGFFSKPFKVGDRFRFKNSFSLPGKSTEYTITKFSEDSITIYVHYTVLGFAGHEDIEIFYRCYTKIEDEPKQEELKIGDWVEVLERVNLTFGKAPNTLGYKGYIDTLNNGYYFIKGFDVDRDGWYRASQLKKVNQISLMTEDMIKQFTSSLSLRTFECIECKKVEQQLKEANAKIEEQATRIHELEFCDGLKKKVIDAKNRMLDKERMKNKEYSKKLDEVKRNTRTLEKQLAHELCRDWKPLDIYKPDPEYKVGDIVVLVEPDSHDLAMGLKKNSLLVVSSLYMDGNIQVYFETKNNNTYRLFNNQVRPLEVGDKVKYIDIVVIQGVENSVSGIEKKLTALGQY